MAAAAVGCEAGVFAVREGVVRFSREDGEGAVDVAVGGVACRRACC